MKNPNYPIALTVAGSDSGGGAGIQADLKTFHSLNVHGVSAITCLTAQNPKGVLGVHACPPAMVALQLEAIWKELPPRAAKTGMLYSAPIISVVAEFLQDKKLQLVLDPVMNSTSGALLLKPTAVKLLQEKLIPLATLLTPNLDEASLLARRPLKTPEDLRAAAREFHERFGCAALIKGGHLKGLKEAMDIFYDGKQELLLSAPFVKGVSTHGTGCTYSAAIAAHLARGLALPEAVQFAKEFITNSIAQSRRAGAHWVLEH